MTPDDLRCSMQARAAELRAIGTAGSYDGFLLVEVPLPWPREISDHPALADLVVPAGVRVQGVVPSIEGRAPTVLYRRPDGPFRGYEGPDVGVTDLLVCTHGTRDRCCGSMGMSLFLSVSTRSGLRIRRTSHTGGHRFAPTAVLLPEGTAWAWLDDAVLAAVLDRSREPVELVDHYRGSTGMPDPWTQVAEAAVFAEVGWSWLDEARSARVVDPGVVLVESSTGDWEVEVEDRGSAPQPVCGEPPVAGGKADPQLFVSGLRQVR